MNSRMERKLPILLKTPILYLAGDTDAGKVFHTLAVRNKNVEENRFVQIRWTSTT